MPIWLLIGVAALGVLCLVAVGTGFVFFGPATSSRTGTAVAAIPATQAPAPAPQTQASSQAPESSATQDTLRTFKDDFSSPSTGWPQADDATRMVGYSEGSMYGIALKTPGTDADILIPHHFQLPLNEADLYFRIRPVQGKGYFGVLCDYRDRNTTTFIGVTEGTYSIVRFINGQQTSLLSSAWVQDSHIQSENGEFQIQLHCGDTIQLMVNGYTLPTANSPSRTKGDIAIFAHSLTDATRDPEFYYEVLIDDVELKAR